MGDVVGAGRWLNPAFARTGRGRAGGERKAELKERRPISARREAAGAGGGARQGMMSPGASGARRGMRVATLDPGGGVRRP